MKFVPVCLCCYFSHYRSKSCKSMAPDSLDSATKQDWTTDIIMFLLWLCHVSPLAELHPCIHNQRTPNFAVYNHTYIYMYRYIYLYICVCVCVLQGHGEADRRLSPGVGGRGRSPLIWSRFAVESQKASSHYWKWNLKSSLRDTLESWILSWIQTETMKSNPISIRRFFMILPLLAFNQS